MTLKEQLLADLNVVSNGGNLVEPDAMFFVDESSIYWFSPSGLFLFMVSHNDLYDYIDECHDIVHASSDAPGGAVVVPEGVGSMGVFWKNLDFNSPFHLSDFIDQINTVNA